MPVIGVEACGIQRREPGFESGLTGAVLLDEGGEGYPMDRGGGVTIPGDLGLIGQVSEVLVGGFRRPER
jgi:hypothetical protein